MSKDALLSLLPLLCPACLQTSKQGLLCDVCHSYLAVIDSPCPRCSEPECFEQVCGQCLKKPPVWQSSHIAWHFEGLSRYLIHRFKYQSDFAAGRALATAWLAQRSPSEPLPDALVAVPMHHRRQFKKGFNQAQWLADYFAKHYQIPVWKSIKRSIATESLEGLNKKQRRLALKGAFELTAKPPSHIAIVDDVYTSGATVNEIARLLAKSGCRQIDVWALARTPLQ